MERRWRKIETLKDIIRVLRTTGITIAGITFVVLMIKLGTDPDNKAKYIKLTKHLLIATVLITLSLSLVEILYTYEIWNNAAQAFYKRNMDIGEYYYNKEETRQNLFKGKPKVFSKSLCEEKVQPWNNKFIDISEDEYSHPKSVQMMKEDGIIS